MRIAPIRACDPWAYVRRSGAQNADGKTSGFLASATGCRLGGWQRGFFWLQRKVGMDTSYLRAFATVAVGGVLHRPNPPAHLADFVAILADARTDTD